MKEYAMRRDRVPALLGVVAMQTTIVPLAFCCISSPASALAPSDWPQWRGPNRDGIATEKNLLQEWPKQGPKLLWQRKDLGRGYSTPSIVGDRIYVLSNKGLDDEFVKAL